VTRQLERVVRRYDGTIRLSTEVLQIIQEHGRVCGVRVRDRVSGEESTLLAPLVVSDIGPRATQALLESRRIKQSDILKQDSAEDAFQDVQEAVGLKVHILSDISLIPHKGIMYCLDTQRIAGMVQPTNSDPSLAPAGKHLLISHQVIRSNNVEEERALALADLRMLFGAQFDTHCKVLTMGTYRGEWPVNRSVQGEDAAPQLNVQGLYLVGDAVKPSGFLMVEGVAQSVNRFLDLLDKLDQERAQDHAQDRKLGRRVRRNVMSPPSRLNAIRWLWKAPGNAGKLK
jgi:phytoene dehydrogenase-like protein